ncbi:MAG TPA: MlaD family protein [Oligoflexus sp.]|uniref:MlaD family protein n=1 Tax=Oligoflexus sp. TaxID=1971216 RepID=UPI002D4BCA15|nr:MlaD family protein [Oligoflexus sp.]HYX33026.1 MlaD family protein [Oligoflexus sp.]
MSRMGTEFKVGLFTLLGLSATAVAIFFVSPELFDRKTKVTYYTILKDASGILENTHVKTNGVNIGRVMRIKLSETATRVELEVLEEVPIPAGSQIAVRTVGFLGDKYIDVVRPENASGEKLPDDGFIPRSPDSADIAEVVKLVGSIAADVKKVTENLASVLGDKKGEQKISNIVDNIEELTANAKALFAENREDVRAMVSNIREVSASLKEITDPENRAKIDRILANFDESMEEVKVATTNIKQISEKIDKGQGTIGRLVNDDTALEEIEGALKDLRQVLAPVTKLQVSVDTHTEMRRDDTSQTYFNLRFTTRPDSYYLIGFTDYSERVVETRTETIDDGLGPTNTRTRESIKDDKALRFNLQMAKRWKWIGARLGLFETTGGAAADVYLWKDRFRISTEVYDFAKKNETVRQTAHIKAYVSVLFFDHLMAMAGIDDPTRFKAGTTKIDPQANYFFGAGLTFNDQDLKALFGMAAIAGSGS